MASSRHLLCLLMAIFAIGFAAKPAEKKYKVLLMAPFSGTSHMNVYQQVAEAVAERGHEVTVLSLQPSRNMLGGKIKEIQLKSVYEQYLKISDDPGALITTLQSDNDPMWDNAKGFLSFWGNMYLTCQTILSDPTFKDFIAHAEKYDVVIHSGFMNDCTIPLASTRLTKSGIILVGPGGLLNPLAHEFNIPHPYAYVPNIAMSFTQPLNYVERVINTIGSIAFLGLEYYLSRPSLDRVIQEKYPGLPSISEAKLANTSMVFITRTAAVDGATPSMPFYKEIGCIPCKPGKPLPKDLQDLYDSSGDAGVIYVSFGSVVPEEYIPEHKKKYLLDAFAKLPQKVIWKYKKPLANVPANVKLVKWAPQQDILAHPKTRAFVTHGGHLSLDETIYHGVPVVSMPVFGDQFTNAAHSEEMGVGLALQWRYLSVDTMINSLKEVMTNPKYKNRVKELSIRLKDQPETPRERAAFWVEYVARHKGAFHLRPDLSHINIAQYYLLDVFALLGAILFLILYIPYKIVCCTCKMLFCRKKKQEKKLKKK